MRVSVYVTMSSRMDTFCNAYEHMCPSLVIVCLRCGGQGSEWIWPLGESSINTAGIGQKGLLCACRRIDYVIYGVALLL